MSDGRTARWEDHRVTRHGELVRAARHAVHDLGPEASMAEIAAHAGTSKPVFYRYFGDKTGLRVAVGQDSLTRMGAALEKAAAGATGPRERIAAMVGAYLDLVDSSPRVYAFVAHGNELGGFVDEVIGLVVDAVRPALSAGEEDEERLRHWAAGAVGSVRGAVEHWLSHPGGLERHELAASVTTWLWDGAAGLLRRARNGAGRAEER